MPFGIDEDWVAAPPDLRGAGSVEYGRTIGIPATHPLVGGSTWGADSSGMQPDWGFSRLVSDSTPGTGAAGAGLRSDLDDWRDALDFRHSPTPWILLALLVAVGFVHLRLNTRVGPAHAHVGLG
jgi:hypothetical protein